MNLAINYLLIKINENKHFRMSHFKFLVLSFRRLDLDQKCKIAKPENMSVFSCSKLFTNRFVQDKKCSLLYYCRLQISILKSDYSQFCNKYIIGNNTHAGEAAVDRAYKDGQNPSVQRYHPKWCKIKPFNYSYHQTHNTTSHTPHTSQHCTPPSNAPTPTQLDHRQSLTPSNALQLGSFLWLTVKLSGFKSFFRTILVFKITQISRKLIGGIIYQL